MYKTIIISFCLLSTTIQLHTFSLAPSDANAYKSRISFTTPSPIPGPFSIFYVFPQTAGGTSPSTF